MGNFYKHSFLSRENVIIDNSRRPFLKIGLEYHPKNWSTVATFKKNWLAREIYISPHEWAENVISDIIKVTAI